MNKSAGTLAGMIEGVSAQRPDALAIVDGETEITFRQLHERILATFAALEELLSPGVPVAVIGPNHHSWVELYYAAPASSRMLVFLNHRLHAQELMSMIERAGAGLVIGDALELDRLRSVGLDIPIFDWESWVVRTQDVAANSTLTLSEPDDIAWLLFTSGTTAAPKGALLSNAGILASVEASAKARPVDADDVYVFPFPLCHVAGYNVVHRHAHGRPVVLLPGFSASTFCDVVEHHRATSTSLAATMLAALVDLLEVEPHRLGQLQSLRSIAYGAAPMPTSLLLRADELLDCEFTQGYGMTELSGNAVFLDAVAHRKGLNGDFALLEAAGRPAPGVELQLVDENGDQVADGEVGEIAIRAAQVMSGYLNDESATAAALQDGWLHTGDIGRMVDGLLYVVDRKKDMVITGGENVSSLEVEAAVLAHPDVARVAVVGVPDPTWGENVCAVVVGVPGVVVDGPAIASFVRASLAGFKSPRHIVVVDELPVTASGKVVKAELRRWLAENPEVLGTRL